MSLRMRLTLLYTGVLIIVLLILSSVLLLATAHIVHREIDENIASKAVSVIKSIRIEDSLFLRELVLPDVDVFATPDTYLQMVDARGRVVSRSSNLGRQYLPLSEYTLRAALQRQKFYETVRAGEQEIRIYNVPLVIDGELVGILQVGRALSPVNNLMARLRLFVVCGGVIAVTLAGILGWFLAKTALRPVERIIETASSIESGGDLSKRIEHNNAPEELSRLAETLNAMFERLETMYQRLQESYELQRRFVSDASHELRTPLTTIRGNAELLLKVQNYDSNLAKEALEDIAGEARRLTRLVEDLLALARADAGYELEKEVVQLDNLLQNISKKARFLGGDEKLLLLNNLCKYQTAIKVNVIYFEQLILILLDNAFKYSPPGSTVELTAQIQREGWLDITVADRGPGLVPGEEKRIFDRFYRGESARGKEGSGLGLAIARWIVNQHAGYINASNRPGGGCIVTVSLPVMH